MDYQFKYSLNGEEKNIVNSFRKIGEAIDGFWKLPEVAKEKANGDYITIISIKEIN